MSKHEGMAKVVEGHKHFSKNVYPDHRELFDNLKDKQTPQVLFITCSDSRIDPALITQTHPGDLFVCRNIGNIVPAHGETGGGGGVAAVLEYAVLALKVKHIIVCGHSDCGAMKALKTPDSPALAAMPSVQGWLRNAEPAVGMARSGHSNPTGDNLTKALIQENVRLQLQHLRTHRVVASGVAEGSLQVHGWVYDIGGGSVAALDEAGREFHPLSAANVARETAGRT